MDVALEARRASPPNERPLEGLDRQRALNRAREIGVEHLVILDARLAKRDLQHCRETRRPLRGRTTYWETALEVMRAGDVRPDAGRAAESGAARGGVIRRKAMEELIQESVGKLLKPMSPR